MFSGGKALEVEKVKEVKSGARREVEQGLTAFVYNFEFCY
jgi:hypothetical protein